MSERSPTHAVLEPGEMARLGDLVKRAAGQQPIGCNDIDALAHEQSVAASALYAAAAVTTDVEFTRQDKVAFVVCGGACQSFGALECLDHLVELRRTRKKKWFKKTFDIQAKGCLNGCEHAPMVRVHTQDGVGYIQRATPEHLEQAVKDVCG